MIRPHIYAHNINIEIHLYNFIMITVILNDLPFQCWLLLVYYMHNFPYVCMYSATVYCIVCISYKYIIYLNICVCACVSCRWIDTAAKSAIDMFSTHSICSASTSWLYLSSIHYTSITFIYDTKYWMVWFDV